MAKKRRRRRKHKPRRPKRERLSYHAEEALRSVGYPVVSVPPSEMPDVIVLRADDPHYRCIYGVTNLGSWFIVDYALGVEMFTRTCDWGAENKHPMATVAQTTRFKAAARRAGVKVDDRA